ncbi:MAG: methyltransferase domain-containing protein [SAR324 cluster bacterium]|uniref:Methyltransferase domain-containing protein n=1 Tax=SAR324 cluster bacterium TaxID=2024889 RepID=A0A7X9ILQ4_9DELT|nr:methyltransferase domain-containing protein [SAR324 cluster bacterium]
MKDKIDEKVDPYATIPYASKVHPLREPSRIAALAALYGFEGARPESASVFEIGCASGQALIPLALMYPEASFYGIDASEAQIEEGKSLILKLGIKNIGLEAKTISEALKEKRHFNYVFAHGVYSWINEDTQQDLLSLIHSSLSDNGLAYISYNTWPGWHFRRILRDFLVWQLPSDLSPLEKVSEARKHLSLFEDVVGYEFERPYSLLMNLELRRIRGESDAYVFHEFLEEENNPVYFRDMLERLAQAKLQYISDARLSRNDSFRLIKDGSLLKFEPKLLYEFPETHTRAQVLDFAFHTPFRESIVSKVKDSPTAPMLNSESLQKLFFSASFESIEGEPELGRETEEEFIDLAGHRAFLSKAVLKAALIAMREAWPRNIDFKTLFLKVIKLGKEKFSQSAFDNSTLILGLLDLAKQDFIDISLNSINVASTISSKPRVSPFAQYQARQSNIVTNLRYESVELGPFERDLIQHLNGERDLGAIANLLLSSLSEDGAHIKEGGETVLDPERQRVLVTTLLNDGLETLRKAALLLEE